MRIGVVSDTHDNTKNVGRIVALFNGARVDRVVHTGDITTAATLEIFSGLRAPMVGVYGNNDRDRPALSAAARTHGMHLVEPPLSLELAGRTLAVVHDPDGIGEPLLEQHRIVLHGHTHRLVHEERDGTLIFNPGECAGHMQGRNVVGVLDLVTLDVELLNF
jgi:putative phosphoesterase